MVFDIDMIREVYALYPKKMKAVSKLIDRPLTLSEKILYTHIWGGEAKEIYKKGVSYVDFSPGIRHFSANIRNISSKSY